MGQLQGKIMELRKRRDGLSQEMMDYRLQMTQLEEQITQMQIERNQTKMQFDEKDLQIKKYNELIEQCEGALSKMMNNSQRLNDALNSALTENRF